MCRDVLEGEDDTMTRKKLKTTILTCSLAAALLAPGAGIISRAATTEAEKETKASTTESEAVDELEGKTVDEIFESLGIYTEFDDSESKAEDERKMKELNEDGNTGSSDGSTTTTTETTPTVATGTDVTVTYTFESGSGDTWLRNRKVGMKFVITRTPDTDPYFSNFDSVQLNNNTVDSSKYDAVLENMKLSVTLHADYLSDEIGTGTQNIRLQFKDGNVSANFNILKSDAYSMLANLDAAKRAEYGNIQGDLDALKNAINNTTTTTTTTSTGNRTTSTNGTGGTGTNGTSSSSGSNTSTRTGDESSPFVAVFAILASLGASAILARKLAKK